MRRLSLAVMVGAGFWCAAPVMADEVKLNVRPGLWETTMTMATNGAPPIPEDQLARMSPEQRAKFEAMFKSAMERANQPHTAKSCLTEAQLRKGPAFGEDNPNCKRTVTSNSGAQWEMEEECTGRAARTVHARFHAVNSELVTGQTDIVMTNGDRTTTSKGTMQSKWLGADCGDVKPMDTGK